MLIDQNTFLKKVFTAKPLTMFGLFLSCSQSVRAKKKWKTNVSYILRCRADLACAQGRDGLLAPAGLRERRVAVALRDDRGGLAGDASALSKLNSWRLPKLIKIK